MKLLNLLALGVEFLLQVSLNHLTSEIILFFLILMEPELLLNDGLYELIPETLDEIELILENSETEEDLLVLELSFPELKLSDPAYFF